MTTVPPFPRQYSAELVNTDGDRTRLFIDGWKRRVELHRRTGQVEIVISRPDKGVIWMLNPHAKTYSQRKLPKGLLERMLDPDMLYDWTEKGVEVIDGRKCRRFIGRLHNPSGPIGDAHEVCFVDARTGMRRRVVSFDVKGKAAGTLDYLNAVVGPLPRNVFKMPEGYKRGYYRRTLPALPKRKQ